MIDTHHNRLSRRLAGRAGGAPDPHNPVPDDPVNRPPDVTPMPPDLPPLPDFDPFPTPVVTPR